MSDPRINKRWRRSIRRRRACAIAESQSPSGVGSGPDDGGWRLVYRPKSRAEIDRREQRAKLLMGTPFVDLPDKPDPSKVLFEIGGHPVTVADVEMVFNDCLLMDAISDYGKDGPLYRDTLNGPMVEIYGYALKAYAGVELPAVYRMPT